MSEWMNERNVVNMYVYCLSELDWVDRFYLIMD